MKKIVLLVCIFLFSAASASWGCLSINIFSPTDDGIVIGDSVKVIIQTFRTPNLDATVNGITYDLTWQPLEHNYRWISSPVPLTTKGDQTIYLKGKLGFWKASGEVSFTNSPLSSVDVLDPVIERFFYMNNTDDLDWNWGPAIFLYGLSQLAPHSDFEETYLDYITAYHENHMNAGLPKINSADTCAPALSAFELAAAFNQGFTWPSVETVMDYIRYEDRNDLGSLDHLGTSLESLFYPSSIWVDSLAMWSLLAVKYGLYTGDTELLEFGLQQPVLFASKLQDPDSGLFYHAWNIPGDCLLPANNTFWLRGNGWVLASVGEMLRLIGPGHASYDQMAAIFVSLAEGSLEWRQPSGYWDTVMTDPGYAYEESSGSALIAFGYARGVNLGLLDDSYMDLAKDTFKAITARMKKRSVGYTMEEISIGTNPSGKWLYSMVPKDRNLSYGVGAFLLLAAELAEESIE